MTALSSSAGPHTASPAAARTLPLMLMGAGWAGTGCADTSCHAAKLTTSKSNCVLQAIAPVFIHRTPAADGAGHACLAPAGQGKPVPIDALIAYMSW